METSFPEVHPCCYPRPDIPVPVDAQRICQHNVGKDEGSIGVPTLVKNTLSFRGNYWCEPAPHCSWGRGVLAGLLHGQLSPMTLTNIVAQDPPVKMQPVVIAEVVFVDSLQQQL